MTTSAGLDPVVLAELLKGASHAYKYGKKKYQARKKAQRSTKFNVKNPPTNGIGAANGTSNSKKFEALQGIPSNLDTRTLYANDLTAIPSTATNQINSRQRNVVRVGGFSVDMIFKNIAQSPQSVNVAVVSGRSQKVPTTSGFFRDYTTSRDVDFSNALNCNEFKGLPISTDKYRILTHKRFVLGGIGGAGDINGINNVHNTKFFCKLNRQLRYNDDSDTLAEDRVYLVWWFDLLMATTGAAPQVGVMENSIRTVTYFDEVKTNY